MKKLELHWKILIGMVFGLLFGFGMTQISWGTGFVVDWIKPLGDIFIKLLKLIAIPLILASLIKGISDLKDISKFRNIGLRTIVIYIVTTIFAITIGLLLLKVRIRFMFMIVLVEKLQRWCLVYLKNLLRLLIVIEMPNRKWKK